MPQDLKKLADLIRDTAMEVRALEEAAHAALHTKNDPQAYRRGMVEKAEILAGLADLASKPLAALPPATARPLRERLERFSKSADTALDLGSVFFMSALLYPEDHQPGDKNDLERFLDEVIAAV